MYTYENVVQTHSSSIFFVCYNGEERSCEGHTKTDKARAGGGKYGPRCTCCGRRRQKLENLCIFILLHKTFTFITVIYYAVGLSNGPNTHNFTRIKPTSLTPARTERSRLFNDDEFQ